MISDPASAAVQTPFRRAAERRDNSRVRLPAIARRIVLFQAAETRMAPADSNPEFHIGPSDMAIVLSCVLFESERPAVSIRPEKDRWPSLPGGPRPPVRESR